MPAPPPIVEPKVEDVPNLDDAARKEEAAAEARKNVTSTTAALLDAAAENKQNIDLAIETAKLTKNVLLNRVSLSLAAQANAINSSKLDVLG